MSGSVIRESRFDAHPGAVLLRIDRPAKRNALREVDMAELGERLHAHHHDPSVRVVFITGTDDAFTSGQDVNDLNAQSGAELAALFERDVDILTRIVTMPKPVVAAVNGVCAGFGNHLAICSDYCVVRSSAMFHFTGAAKGIPSPMLGTLLLPMAIGSKRAKALYLRGGRYPPAKALADGFCNEVVEEREWDEVLGRLAGEFSGRNRQVMALNKHLLNFGAMQMLGAVKLSGIAGAGILSAETALVTGRADSGAIAPKTLGEDRCSRS